MKTLVYTKINIFQALSTMMSGGDTRIYIPDNDGEDGYSPLLNPSPSSLRLVQNKLYIIEEVDIDWKDKVREFVENASHLDLECPVIEHCAGLIAEEQFIDMCKLVVELTEGLEE